MAKRGDAELVIGSTRSDFEIVIRRWLAHIPESKGCVEVAGFGRALNVHLSMALTLVQLRASGRFLAWWDPSCRYSPLWLSVAHAAMVREPERYTVVVPASHFQTVEEGLLYCDDRRIHHETKLMPRPGVVSKDRQPVMQQKTEGTEEIFSARCVVWDRRHTPLWATTGSPDIPGVLLRETAGSLYGTVPGGPYVVFGDDGLTDAQMEKARAWAFRRGAKKEHGGEALTAYTPLRELVGDKVLYTLNADGDGFTPAH